MHSTPRLAASLYRLAYGVLDVWCAGGGVEPLKPIVEMTPAAHIAAIVSERSRRGVSQLKWWLCSHVLKPVAADAAAIAHPAHMRAA